MELLIWTAMHLLLVAEAALTGLAVVIAWKAPQAGRRWLARLERALAAVARHRAASVAGVGLLALAARAVVTPLAPVREPAVHDEFSYLLAADTFASGRLANPTHPLWEHFESMHIEHQPTYASMYPPGQGLVLALGQVLFHEPSWGVWLSTAGLCAALCWMLQGWLPPLWALAGGLVAVARLGLFSYWADSYWGGSVAAAGGALLLGAVPRLLRAPRAREALLLGAGAALMLNTRPYEGMVIALAAGVVVTIGLVRRRLPMGLLARRVVGPLAAVLLATGAWMAYYNWRVFGNPLTPPYAVNRQTYAQAPYFVFQAPRPAPVYRHEELRSFYGDWELNIFRAQRTPAGFLDQSWYKISASWLFYLGPALTLPLVALAGLRRDRRVRPLIWIGLALAAACLPIAFFNPHYIAPATGLIYALLLEALRRLRTWRRRRGTGLLLARASLALCAVMVPLRAAAALVPGFNLRYPQTWATSWRPNVKRGEVLKQLPSGERHLVIVRYGPQHSPFLAYVYNAADIDRSPVVWARDMGARNEELLRYYPDRRVWLLEADRRPLKVAPYAVRPAR